MSSPADISSRSGPINATWLRRNATLFAVALLKRFRKHFSDVLFVTDGICVKYSTRVDFAEAATLEYVRRHSSMPVPKVHSAFEHAGKSYIVIEKLPGRKLACGWRKRSEESKTEILSQLKAMIDELRSLKSPVGQAVVNVNGGSLTDPRLPGLGLTYPVKTSSRFGPFDDIRGFHCWLRRPAEEVNKCNYPDVNELINAHETSDWRLPVLTHGDLSSLNMLVKDDRVTGIIDWEAAGWYPSYWEYTTAMQVNFRNEFWEGYIHRFIEPRPDELRMEHIRQTYFGGR